LELSIRIIDEYNTVHSRIKQKPIDVFNGKEKPATAPEIKKI